MRNEKSGQVVRGGLPVAGHLQHGHQFFKFDGLCNVFIHACLLGLHLDADVGEGRAGHNKAVVNFAEFHHLADDARGLEAVHFRHVYVHQEEQVAVEAALAARF